MEFATEQDTQKIIEIARRDSKLTGSNKMAVMMDVDCCHSNGCRLDLDKLLSFDDGNFLHDTRGISANLNRKTYQLENCFLPRCAIAQ